MTRGQCQAIGCRAAILDRELFCGRHAGMVESDTRRALDRTWRPANRRQSETFAVLLETAQREILYFQMNGHHTPRDRPFEWDEVGR